MADKEQQRLSDSDNMVLHEQAEEIRHRRWAVDRATKAAKWVLAVLLGAVAAADAVSRIFEKVAAWWKH